MVRTSDTTTNNLSIIWLHRRRNYGLRVYADRSHESLVDDVAILVDRMSL